MGGRHSLGARNVESDTQSVNLRTHAPILAGAMWNSQVTILRRADNSFFVSKPHHATSHQSSQFAIYDGLASLVQGPVSEATLKGLLAETLHR